MVPLLRVLLFRMRFHVVFGLIMTLTPIQNILTQDDEGNWFTICPSCQTRHFPGNPNEPPKCCGFRWQDFDETGELNPGWAVVEDVHTLVKVVA